MQSNNLALTSVFTDPISSHHSAFLDPTSFHQNTTGSGVMTVQGTVTKTGILLALCILSAGISWNMPTLAIPFMLAGSIGGLIIAITLVFKPQWAMVGGPVYALLQGLSMGAISAIFNAQYPGIAFQAITLTFSVMVIMLVAYTSGVVRATQKFKMGVIIATGGIALFYLISLPLMLFGFHNPALDSGLIGIAFSLLVVVIAALNLVLDFAFIEEASANGAPQYMEWYGAFGLMVTLVWLYLEILRLLSKLKSRD